MIGILSDSHDNLPALRRAVGLFKEAGCKLIIHAGDFVAPFAARELEKSGCLMRAVFGNCDGEKKGLISVIQAFGTIQDAPLTFNYNDINILVSHLNMPVENYAAQQKYDIIIIGHTHNPDIQKSGKTLIINPGETGGWLTGKSTIAFFCPETGKAEIIVL